MNKRIIGIDVARALAVIGMIIVNFKVVFGDNGSSWLKTAAQLFDGKAAATFVVLAGIGLALMTNRAVWDDDWAKIKTARKRIIKRSLFLFVIGLSYLWIWPADILHFYGVYMLLTLLFIHRPGQQILVATAALILLFPILLLFFDYEAGWDFSTLTYSGFWTFSGFFRNLLFNGFHPVIPWASFMLFGLWYGRQDLRDDRFLEKSLQLSLAVFVTVQLLSIGLINSVSGNSPESVEAFTIIFGTSPMPPMPLYMLNGISISTLVISASIIVAKRYENNTIISLLHQTGQLALTFYVAHVVVGMGAVEVFGTRELGSYSIRFSVLYALAFSLLCILFARVWLTFKKAGPLEWVMRKVTG